MTSLRLRATLAAALALGSAGAATIGAAQSAPAPAPAAIGPAVGARIPTGAALIESNGTKTTLSAVAHGKPVMVILFRSAKWCPYCQGQLKSRGPVAAAAKAKGVGFIAVSYDSPADLAAFAAKQSLTFPLYSDTGSKMIDALKLRDPRYPADSFAYGVPYPTTLLIDARGTVKGKTIETDYKIRPTNADLIALLAKV
ncbi:redoxin domain-containing protein [Sphingomonas psychrolutea]|uniref:thioredoxin-dependent peroxiredoxin n=1 Tax=Sphingomonas psychrolutea TaxID=1259676 RepID=A0ABQ1GTS8_9SPHN|nr:redoxin domain-containing protein [Sphingomonas psychrolutea]GGA50221.1 peroxiredoxin [Sphingomonas psychrolutea]